MALIMIRSVATIRSGFFKLKRSSSGIRAFSSLLTSPPSKAVVYERHGPPDAVTRLIEMEGVEVKEKDVCVKMLAAPINPSDLNRIEGVYPVRPPLPAVGGYEGVGEVLSVGSAVKHLSPGDWVIPSPPSSGMWQTYTVKEEGVWHKISKDSPVEYAATITVNPLTSLRMLQDFVTLNSGDCIVQNGATSIVGQCIIQLARLRGIHSINIIRDRFEFLKRSFRIGIIAIKLAGKVLWPKIQCIFGHPIGTTTSALILFAHQYENGHNWSIRCRNQVIQKPKFIYTSRATTFMKRPKSGKIIYITKILVQSG